ncbi:MAG TPA: sigma-54 dependent transcriptional regulator [Acidobacteriota bacterium]|jgi:two-component system response regulator PilR (NtrC family)|nr:sigma-54 dependent transcriptional regulator [Acidobacteriota bacterium]
MESFKSIRETSEWKANQVRELNSRFSSPFAESTESAGRSHGQILIIDDEEIMRDVLTKLLRDEGYACHTAKTGEEGLEKIREGFFDLVLLDLMMPGIGGMSTLEQIHKVDSGIVVVILTAYASIESAVQATRAGAFDFLAKPFKNEELLLVVQNGLQKRKLQLENQQLRRTLKERSAFENIVGKSDKMQQVFDLISQVAPRRSTILIQGESGTGKELVAKAIHNLSPRADEPFVAVNTSTIPSELLESELFGHVKGAFTGASSAKKGLFEVADRGTIFLDEVGTIPFETQTRLLRVIQEREFRRVGGIDNIKVDVRIIAATNSDLKKSVEEQRFREDLYYRLNVITIPLPPLRERKIDVPLLVDFFIRRYCKENSRDLCALDPEALKVLLEHDWPGNVRELENAIERAVVLAPSERIMPDLFPREVLESAGTMQDHWELLEEGASLKDLVADFERNLIHSALKRTDGNQKKAAQLLRLNATTLNEKLKRLKIRAR